MAAEAAHGRSWRLDFAGWRWTHLDLQHPQASARLAAEGWLPGDALDMMREEDDAPRLDRMGDVVLGVMPDFALTGVQDERPVVSWRFAMRADRIVTGQRTPGEGLAAARSACEADTPPAGPAELVDHVLSSFAATVVRRAAGLDTLATGIEDELLDENTARLSALRARLGRVRREAARLQRVALPVERLTREDVQDLPGWAASQVHETARRRILGAVDDLRALAEHGRALQDELAARQAEATTANLNALSVLSAVLLPPTLVAGFFGMNTEGLPFKEWPEGTWWATGVGVASGVLTLLGLRLSRKI